MLLPLPVSYTHLDVYKRQPIGWNVVFKPNYKQATSAQVEANSTQNVSIDITPPANVEAGSYKIPVRAATGTTSAELELEEMCIRDRATATHEWG